MTLEETWIPAHQQLAWVCDAAGCGVKCRVADGSPALRPAGYYVEMERVTEAGNHNKTPDTLYFHDKLCMLAAIQYQASALMQPYDVNT